MLASVWLKKLIVQSLINKNNILYYNYELLSKKLGMINGQIGLFEPDGSMGETICISAETVWLQNVNEGDYPVQNQLETSSVYKSDIGVFVPLSTENATVFGFLFHNSSESFEADAEEIWDAVKSFSAVLYSESLGSIISSFNDTAVQVKNLCVEYKNGSNINRVVNDVSFNICNDELMVILGPSGCGKTSMLNAVGGMLTPSGGSVLWNGCDVAQMTDKQKVNYRRNDVGFIFQRYNLIANLTAEENVRVAADMVNDPIPIKEVFEMVGLADKMKNYPRQLSGGEQQRVCIARALVKKAKLLLCDEPTGALDSKNAENIIKILQNIAKEKHIPVVVITHNPQLSVVADHYLFMSNGRIENELYQPFPIPAERLSLS